MALQDIDSVNLPSVVLPDVTIPILTFGLKHHYNSYNELTDEFIRNVSISSYDEGSYFYLTNFTCLSDYCLWNTYFPSGSYVANRSYFRFFIGNYATVSSFKLIFLIENDKIDINGSQYKGYTPGVESRLMMFSPGINIKTTMVWSTFNLINPTVNLIDNISISNRICTITFNASGRSLITGVTTGYVDLGSWIRPSSCVPIPEPLGYCLTSLTQQARLEITY